MFQVRVRFAPSPTGYLHIGSVRTALFNYLYAKSQRGVFLLRIEDTDLERSRPEYETEIMKSMEWLGFQIEEEVLRQSSHFELYLEMAGKLVKEEKAFVSTEKGGRAIVLKMPKTRVKFHDLVHGTIEFDTTVFEDLVLIKSDGSPTYNFACVIDDHAMKISHVIRGDDHISNTPKQIVLYEAMDYPLPTFAHLPLIVGKDGSPLSKRHGDVSLRAYQEEGFLPQALLNYLALLGWSSGDDQEIFSVEELVRKFSMNRVNSKSACFDNEKLQWLNAEHLRALDDKTYETELVRFLRKYHGFQEGLDEALICRAAKLFRGRIKTFKEFVEQADYFFRKDLSFDSLAIRKYWKDERVKDHLVKLSAAFEPMEFRDASLIETKTRALASELGLPAGALIHPMRVALTGRSVSPGLFDLMMALGKDLVLSRLRYTIEHFSDLKEGLCA